MNCNLTHSIIYKKDMQIEQIVFYLEKSNKIICDFFEVESTELNLKFSSKKIRDKKERTSIVFNALIKSLLNVNVNLNKTFIEDAFTLNTDLNKADSAKKFHKDYKINFSFDTSYLSPYSQGLSLFLLLMHFDKLITLPFKFTLPILKIKENDKSKRMDIGLSAYPLMLKQIRSLDSQNINDEESKFLNSANKSLIISYGSSLLIALGWTDFSDVNLDELLYFREFAVKELGCFENNHPPYALLVSFLSNKSPDNFKLTLSEWKNALVAQSKKKNNEKKAQLLLETSISEKEGKVRKTTDNEVNISYYLVNEEINEIWKYITPKSFSVDNLKNLIKQLPEYRDVIENWIVLENSYFNKVRVENYKTIESSLGYLNIYLFFVLPVWYKNNKTTIAYPRNPTDLKAGTFISTLIKNDDIKPPTFLDFISDVQKQREIKNESIYSIIKSVEKFFNFLEVFSEDLPGCSGFVQPISMLDYPKVSKSRGTNKGLIPRYLFSTLNSYIEAISVYNNLINSHILTEEIDNQWVLDKLQEKTINTLALQNEIGFIPFIYVNNDLVILELIPNCLDIKPTALKDGRILKIHYPHVLNHIQVVLQTGLRNNHIQWLDAEKFNCLVKEDANSFTSLYVNTDKSKTSAWTPIVHKKVIKILNDQLDWRGLINNPQFNKKKFYNNNSQTKWGQFYPLFSYTTEGLPYSDNHYLKEWIKILVSFQDFIKTTTLKYIELAKFLPVGIKFDEFNMDMKLKEVKEDCQWRWTSDITPHSARVSVISHYITALPADIIGQYITGQTEAVVHHYVKLDPNYLTELEEGQREGLARMAIEKEFEQLSGKETHHPIFADKDNSNLAKSFSINKQETITQYGCISISIKEEGKTGIDLLLEESNAKIAFNKTEICPYNNNCPADLIKELKGIRRCGICPYAVRSIDHLPAIAIKKRQFMEFLQNIENKLTEAISKENAYSIEELDSLQEERQRITEELLGWIVSEEILESNRKLLANNQSTTQYIVKKPEILIEKLQQITKKEGDVEYLLTRLNDCESFPNFDTPIIKAKFDMLRRQLLARLNDFKGAFDSKIPVDPAHECLGLLREVINRFGLTHEQTINLLSTNMLSLEDSKIKPLLELNYVK